MSTLDRDKQILDLVSKTYDFQFELREKLDSKLNNFVAITGTLSSISLAVALFVFERINLENPFYIPLLIVSALFRMFHTRHDNRAYRLQAYRIHIVSR
jgi:hypothetical protein